MEPGITNEEEKKNVTARSTMVQSGRSVQAQQFNMQHLVAPLITALDPSPSTHPPLRMQHKAAHQHHRLNPHRADTPEKRWAAQRTKSQQNNPPSPTGPLQLVLKSPQVSYAPPPPARDRGVGRGRKRQSRKACSHVRAPGVQSSYTNASSDAQNEPNEREERVTHTAPLPTTRLTKERRGRVEECGREDGGGGGSRRKKREVRDEGRGGEAGRGVGGGGWTKSKKKNGQI